MKLASILAEFHEFEGKSDWLRPLRVRLEFADAPPIRVGLMSDGESMRVDSLPLEEPADLGECGATLIREVTERFAPGLCGADVDVQGIAAGETPFAGVAIVHDGCAALCFWNWGDELVWGEWEAICRCDWGSAAPRLVHLTQC